MSLTVHLKNIGILKQAEFSLGDLTLICGENNTGKTYTAHALYGFLKSWRNLIRVPISDAQIQRSLEGEVKIESKQETDQMLAEACKIYTKQLDEIFAAREDTFQNSEFRLLTDEIDVHDKELSGSTKSPQGQSFIFSSKRKASGELSISLGIEKEPKKEFDINIAKRIINVIIADAIFSDSLPRPFMFSSERTGVTIFRRELDFARNRLLEEMGRSDQKIDLRELLLKGYQRYPLSVEDDVEFTRQLQDVAKSKSFIAKEHPEALADFADIIGGDYAVTQDDQLYYKPKGARIRLPMGQSSSSVRSLLAIGFYLRCVVEKGDLLMVDEPELSLHPENQRRIARLFARLVNLGVKVFITTHSDYIVKELNTLIMLNHDKPHLKRVAEENGYQDSELINADQVKVYVAEEKLMPLEEGQKRRKRGHTLVPANIHPELGIGVSSFDKTIDDMNRIQSDIVWGAK